MDQDRNHPQPGELPPAAPSEDRVPGAPEPDAVVRWVTAAFLAAAALLGLVVLVAILTFALQPPGWLQMILGVLMVAGAVFFAWLVASALGKDTSGSGDDSRRR